MPRPPVAKYLQTRNRQTAASAVCAFLSKKHSLPRHANVRRHRLSSLLNKSPASVSLYEREKGDINAAEIRTVTERHDCIVTCTLDGWSVISTSGD